MLAVACLVFVPIGLVNFAKDFVESERLEEKEEAEKQDAIDLEKKKYNTARKKY